MAAVEEDDPFGPEATIRRLQEQNKLLIMMVNKAKEGQSAAEASFNAAKLANAFLNNRMAKLEAELNSVVDAMTAQQEEQAAAAKAQAEAEAVEKQKAESNSNSGAAEEKSESGGDGAGSGEDAEAKPGEGQSTPEGRSSPMDDPVMALKVKDLELEAFELREQVIKLGKELTATKKAMQVIVEAFGQENVVSRIREHKAATARAKAGEKAAARAKGSSPKTTASPRKSPKAKAKKVKTPQHSPAARQSPKQAAAASHKQTTPKSVPVQMPAFLQQASPDVSPSKPIPRTTQSPFTSITNATHDVRQEFASLHPLVPLGPDPIPVDDFLSEFRSTKLPATHQFPHTPMGPNRSSQYSSPPLSRARPRPTPGKEARARVAVATYVKQTVAAGSPDAADPSVTQEVQMQVGSFINRFKRRVHS